MGLFGFGSPSPSESFRLARLERKLDLILEHLGLELPEPDELEEVRERALAGDKIGAIKLYRELTHAGLADAKSAVEDLARGSRG